MRMAGAGRCSQSKDRRHSPPQRTVPDAKLGLVRISHVLPIITVIGRNMPRTCWFFRITRALTAIIGRSLRGPRQNADESGAYALDPSASARHSRSGLLPAAFGYSGRPLTSVPCQYPLAGGREQDRQVSQAGQDKGELSVATVCRART